MLPTRPKLQPAVFAVVVVLLNACATVNPNSPLRVDYTVEIRDAEARLFHVTASIKNVAQPRLELSS